MDKNFKNDVSARPGGENINYCISCGSCTATCPVSELDSTYNPRLIIKKVQLGMKEEVLKSNDLWKCIQCHRCVAHCPQNVKFADIVRVLRDLSVEEGYYPESMLKEIDDLDRSINQYRLKVVDDHLKGNKTINQVIKELNSGGEGDD